MESIIVQRAKLYPVDRRRVLEHPTRRFIMDFLATPRRLKDISAAIQEKGMVAGRADATYHLRTLQRAGLIDIDAGLWYVLGGALDQRRDRARIRALHHPTAARLYAEICQAPGVDAAHLMVLLGTSRTATIWHLRRLEREGLVRSWIEHRSRHYAERGTGHGSAERQHSSSAPR